MCPPPPAAIPGRDDCFQEVLRNIVFATEHRERLADVLASYDSQLANLRAASERLSSAISDNVSAVAPIGDALQHHGGGLRAQDNSSAVEPILGALRSSTGATGAEEFAPSAQRVRHLRVSIVSATGLRNADWVGKSDPYCVCWIPSKADSRCQTKHINNTLDPEWNEVHEISDYEPGDRLEFEVYDYDVVGKHDLLGRTTLGSTIVFEGFCGELQLSGGGLLRVRVQPANHPPDESLIALPGEICSNSIDEVPRSLTDDGVGSKSAVFLPFQLSRGKIEGEVQHDSPDNTNRTNCSFRSILPELRQVWNEEVKPSRRPTRSVRIAPLKSFRSRTMAGDEKLSTGFLQRLILKPTSSRRIVIDILSLFVIMYDLIVLPLGIFDFEEMSVPKTLRLIVTIFWTIDIACTFCSGYQTASGVIEMRPSKIASRYLRGWFLPELILVLLDWYLVIASQKSSGAQMARVGKVFRFARLSRMLRMVRVLRFVHVFDELVQLSHIGGQLLEYLDVLKLLMGVVFTTHIVACAWYWLGLESQRFGKESWLDVLTQKDASLVYRYGVAFHWAIAQFTPAPVSYKPMNAQEHYFAICVLLLGFMMFSSFLGSMTSSMTRLRIASTAKTQQEELVRKYLKQNKVTLDLGNRITSYLKQTQRKRPQIRVHEDGVAAFKDLPLPLRRQLRCEVYMPTMCLHPFFHHLAQDHTAAMSDICLQAMSPVSVERGGELFSYNTEALHMYFVVSGTFKYFEGQSDEEAIGQDIVEDQWMCEAALWMQCQHWGRLTSDSAFSEVMQLDAKAFHNAIKRDSVMVRRCKMYARLFAKLAMQPNSGSMVNIWDVWSNFDDVQEIAQRAFGFGDVVGDESQTVRVTLKRAGPTQRWSV
eukprot:gnl/TRDRNA2_/TRDRNA2_191035_c0_seq1.p1 gnl/TRDRNA2_/TRDRNA2_191035_c0~~gnl/TRDRNA2_/TRDRNA2_191035_c0_seq1.p1  ORF type:complete len:875 (-),score=119.38 gnl/TRDRNA2_/TRDRNA2_191035_c0_seq1:67-2691(-)